MSVLAPTELGRGAAITGAFSASVKVDFLARSSAKAPFRGEPLHVDGELAAHHLAFTFRRYSKTLDVASIGRDRESLRAELAFEEEQAR
jgi:hypothetical protein